MCTLHSLRGKLPRWRIENPLRLMAKFLSEFGGPGPSDSGAPNFRESENFLYFLISNFFAPSFVGEPSVS